MNKDDIRAPYSDERAEAEAIEYMQSNKAAVEAALAADREAALRDVFATAAMGAIISSVDRWPDRNPTSVAQLSFRYADAMLAERKHKR